MPRLADRTAAFWQKVDAVCGVSNQRVDQIIKGAVRKLWRASVARERA